MNAAMMFAEPRRAYLLLATEPELDAANARDAAAALAAAEFVVSLAAHNNDAAKSYADVLLPMAAFTETAGYFVNCEGRVQHAAAAALPHGEARPAWKILRVLGNFLDLDGFDYVSLTEVNADIPHRADAITARHGAWDIPSPEPSPSPTRTGNNDDNDNALCRLMDIPMYRGDAIVRNAPALQKTADNPPPSARINGDMMRRFNRNDGDKVIVKNGAGAVTLPLQTDARIPAGCVYVPAGYTETIALGAHGKVTLEPAQ